MNDVSYAEIAVELRLLVTELQDCADELAVQADRVGAAAQNLEFALAKLNLPPAIAENLLTQAKRRTVLIHRAHQIFKQLIPHQTAVEKLLQGDAKSQSSIEEVTCRSS